MYNDNMYILVMLLSLNRQVLEIRYGRYCVTLLKIFVKICMIQYKKK